MADKSSETGRTSDININHPTSKYIKARTFLINIQDMAEI